MWSELDPAFGPAVAEIGRYVEAAIGACNSADPAKSRGIEWAKVLSRTTKGSILLTSIAIDLAAPAIAPELLLEVLGDTDWPSGMEPCRQLADSLFKHVETGLYTCRSALKGDRADHEYVRILELGSFIKHFVQPESGRNINHNQVWEAWESLVEDGGQLDGIERWWGGRLGRCWVMPKQDFEDLRAQADREAPGTIFFDSLGIPYQSGYHPGDKRPYAVAVSYPVPLTDAKFESVQPTILDADWDPNEVFYISNGPGEGWGLTHCCSGTRSGCRERVHPRVQGLTASFAIVDLGVSIPIDNSDATGVLADAIERFRQVRERSTGQYDSAPLS